MVDVSREQGVKKVFVAVDEKLGGLDILVNNTALAAGSVTEDDYEDWRHILNEVCGSGGSFALIDHPRLLACDLFGGATLDRIKIESAHLWCEPFRLASRKKTRMQS